MIDSLATASRYLAELTPTLGHGGALERIRARCSPAVAAQLDTVQQHLDRAAGATAHPHLSLYSAFLRQVTGKSQTADGMRVINTSLADARRFADSVRTGLPGDLYYSAALLLVLCGLSVIWIGFVAPEFAALYAAFGRPLPAFTALLIGSPWLLILALACVAALLALLIVGTRRIAESIGTLAPLGPGWVSRAAGPRLTCAHDSWRVATLASALAASGRDPLEAFQGALAETGVTPESVRELADAIELADGLGLGRHELDNQRDAQFGNYRRAVEHRRATWSRAMQVLIALLVGIVAICTYLPIFSMGTIL